MLGVLLRRLAPPIENQTGAAIEPNPHRWLTDAS